MNPDPRTDRDRTLRRVRGTTVAAGLGAVAVTGALTGLLGHAAADGTEAASTSAGSGSTDTGSTGATGSGATGSTGSDSLSSPTASPTTDPSLGDDQPSVVTGGS